MKNNLLTYIKTKEFVFVFACLLISIMLYIPNIFLERASFLWMFSIPIGLFSLFIAIKSNRKILIIVSVMIILSFPIMWGGFSISDAINHNIENNKTVTIVLPEGTKAIQPGEIYDYLDEDKSNDVYIYFSQTKCHSCKIFEDVLIRAIKDTDAVVYYYNVEEMPATESDITLSTLEIDRVPLLTKIQNGTIKDSTSSNDIGDIKLFLNENYEVE